MKKMWVFVLAAALIVGFSLPAIAGSCGYVVNGDFEVTDKLNLGFVHGGYVYLEYPVEVNYWETWLNKQGQMTIVEDPGLVHGWDGFKHDGNMLVVNGSKKLEAEIWGQTFDLSPDTNYVFSFELANVVGSEPAQIVLMQETEGQTESVYGPAGVEFNVVGVFHRFEVIINSGPTGVFDLYFTNTNIAYDGNDFAMDNICLTDLQLSVDIKPGSCPNAFNLKQKGVIPVAIMGSDIFDVERLDQDSVWLCLANDDCIAPLRVETLDAGIPWINQEDSCLPYSASSDEYGSYYDKLSDISLKFDSNELAVMLIGAGYEPGDFVPLTIKADYYYTDSSPKQELQGQDWIVIVNK